MKLYTYSTLEERVQKPHISCVHAPSRVSTLWLPTEYRRTVCTPSGFQIAVGSSRGPDHAFRILNTLHAVGTS